MLGERRHVDGQAHHSLAEAEVEGIVPAWSHHGPFARRKKP